MSRKTTTKKAKLRAPRHSIRRRTAKAAATPSAALAPVVPPAMTLVACPMCGTSVFRAGLKGHLIYACSYRGSDAANAALFTLDHPEPVAAPAVGPRKAKAKRARA
jgi:hypothetical protein